MDDNELAGRAAAGDEVAFELLVRRHVDACWRFARSMLHDDFAAEEAVQDAFVNAYGALGAFRRESSFRTWLLAICRRVCIDRLRARRAPVVSIDRLKAGKAREQEMLLGPLLEDAIDGLPDVERDAFVLVDVLGYSREEAAEIVDVPPSTMRSRVARARGRLAESLGGSDIANGGTT